MAKKDKLDLSTLPRHITRKNKGWWINHATGNLIPDHRITDYLPRTPIDHDLIISKRYDLRANN